MRTWNPYSTQVLTGSKVHDWKVLNDEFFASLIVSPERAAEIMRLYPEDEMTGRPGLFAPSDDKLRATRGKLRNTDADARKEERRVRRRDGDVPDDAETWRTMVEFADEEDTLEESEFAVAAD
jgi:hypothetical protein